MKSSPLFFNKKLHTYEERLIEFLLDIGDKKRINPKLARISIYLLFHGSLTQNQLKDMTGFSIGSISSYLSKMEELKIIKTHVIPDTRTMSYSFNGIFKDLISRGLEIFLNSILSAQEFLKHIKEELQELIIKNKKGAKHLDKRIDELLKSFEVYKNIQPVLN